MNYDIKKTMEEAQEAEKNLKAAERKLINEINAMGRKNGPAIVEANLDYLKSLQKDKDAGLTVPAAALPFKELTLEQTISSFSKCLELYRASKTWEK
jgi:exonuclease VII small subunit